MPRYKQVFNCTSCRRRRWREVETEWCDPVPDVERLKRGAHCSDCGCRDIDVRQFNIGPRVSDQTLPGGMVWGLVGFGSCVARDRERRQALADYRQRWGEDYAHPLDPEFGGPPSCAS